MYDHEQYRAHSIEQTLFKFAKEASYFWSDTLTFTHTFRCLVRRRWEETEVRGVAACIFQKYPPRKEAEELQRQVAWTDSTNISKEFDWNFRNTTRSRGNIERVWRRWWKDSTFGSHQKSLENFWGGGITDTKKVRQRSKRFENFGYTRWIRENPTRVAGQIYG